MKGSAGKGKTESRDTRGRASDPSPPPATERKDKRPKVLGTLSNGEHFSDLTMNGGDLSEHYFAVLVLNEQHQMDLNAMFSQAHEIELDPS